MSIIKGIILTFFLLLLTSCSIRDRDANSTVNAHFIEDVEHLMYVLTHNFALMDAAAWIRGVDIRVIGEEVITQLQESEEIDVDNFADLLQRSFISLLSYGHFAISRPHSNLSYPINFPCYGINSEVLYDALPYLFELSAYELNQSKEILASQMGDERAEDLIQAILDQDIEQIIYIMEQDFPLPATITTEIIEYNRIAYIRLRGFPQWDVFNQRSVFDFLETIRDYEHLIIDLRGNRGGDPTFFYRTLVEPIISEPHQARGFAFFYPGNYVTRHISGHRRTTFGHLITTQTIPNTVAELIDMHPMLELKPEDVQRLTHGFEVYTTISPRKFAQFDFGPAFFGQVWMLTDENSQSAAQIAAWFAYESGFATLVGEATGGVFGGPRTQIRLPGSDITVTFDVFYVTNPQGRPLEAGTLPHHFNLPGLNALETALALIGLP
jgi:hypothetical protein